MVMLALAFVAEAGVNATFNVAVCEGPRIRPPDTPLVVNAVLVEVTLLIVMFMFPELVRDTLSVLVAPTVTFPKARLAGLAPRSELAAVPVPLREIGSEESEPLLRIVAVPANAVADEGRKETLNVILAPGAIVVEGERPDSPKPAPEMEARFTLTLALPVFVSEMVCEFTRPIATEPKLTLEGVAERLPKSVSGANSPLDRPADGKPTTAGTSPLMALFGMDWGAAPAGEMLAARRIAQPTIQRAAWRYEAAECAAEQERLKNLRMVRGYGGLMSPSAYGHGMAGNYWPKG
jgi:hypothetical protein